MPERLRTESTPAPDGLSPNDRDNRIEELLVAGLDDYFAGEYERAITAWTRVLFIDRGHPRAKAYIDRARSAIAERQRESEELLHRGVAAFNRGESESARRLLTSVVERGGPQEVALAFLERLARLERPDAPAGRVPGALPHRRPRPREGSVAPRQGHRRAAWLLPIVVLLGLAGAVLYVQDSRERIMPFLFQTNSREEPPVATRVQEALPVPRAAEIDLARARALLEAGHARDALRLVERVRPADPLRGEADALREDIQRVLLSGGVSAPQPVEALLPPAQPATRDQ